MDLKYKNIKTRIIIHLFDDYVPKTAYNFRFLCVQGLNGGKSPYIGSKIFRVIKGHFIQGGDIETNNGKGGYSVYGKYFKDENFKLKHNQPGLLAMTNKGKNMNNSQFLISTNKKGEKLFDNKYVVFGIILKGYDIINKIEQCKVNKNFTPFNNIIIDNCGIISNEDKEELSFSI